MICREHPQYVVSAYPFIHKVHETFERTIQTNLLVGNLWTVWSIRMTHHVIRRKTDCQQIGSVVSSKLVGSDRRLGEGFQKFVSEGRTVNGVVQGSSGTAGHGVGKLRVHFLGVISRGCALKERSPCFSSVAVGHVPLVEFFYPSWKLGCIVTAGNESAVVMRIPEGSLGMATGHQNGCPVF